MKVWLYYRLSRDEDAELNSLTNQRNILIEYAKSKKLEVVGESFDDNVSGMHFNREGIDKIYEQVEQGNIDAVLVKDLSRLGRHRTQTAMFIDYLRENEVRVISATENIDSFNEEDDLLIGFKGIMNDMYAKDISKKIRAGYKQKQRDGIIIIPPFGYFKDKNTGELVIVEEEAEIVRKIYDLYLEGYGLKNIAHILNEMGIKSPLFYQNKHMKKQTPCNKPKITNRFLWVNTTVKRILQNEFYKGTLICHKTYTSKIYHIRKVLPKEEHFVHDDYVPAIISKEKWRQVQFLLESKVRNNVRVKSVKPCHGYTGLLVCAECGCSFICKTRRWKNKPDRYEYTCNGYHRYGTEYCTSHRINESTLDDLIYRELLSIKNRAVECYQTIEEDVKNWQRQKSNINGKLKELNNKLEQRKSDQRDILIERIRDKAHSDAYDAMLKECDADIRRLSEEISEITDYNAAIRKRKSEMKNSIELIDEIIGEGAISDTNLRLLVNKIEIGESDGRLKIKINLNGQFKGHTDLYDDNGDIKETVYTA